MKPRFANPPATPAPTPAPAKVEATVEHVESGLTSLVTALPQYEYRIIMGETAMLLEQRVNAALLDGFTLMVGGVAVEASMGGTRMYQALARMTYNNAEELA